MTQGSDGVRVESVDSSNREEWDRFVRRCPSASCFHLFGWRDVVERVFGYRAEYLVARLDNRLVGVLPLFLVRSLTMKRGLISLPFAIRGGPIADSEEVVDELILAAEELAERLEVDYLELRSESLDTDLLARDSSYVTFQADLTLSEDELLRKMERKRRQMMNYCKRAGFEAWTAKEEQLDLFYSLFCRSMRSHGTPVYSKSFLRAIMKALPGEAELYFVDHEGETVAGVFCLNFREVLLPFYAGMDRDRRLRGLNDFIYWSMMQWGRSAGYRIFDFGRSRVDTGPYKFKSRWGMTEIPLAYHYKVIRGDGVPTLRPDNPKLQGLIHLWRKLPLPVTRVIGPFVAKKLP